jgi:hypothetical protein
VLASIDHVFDLAYVHVRFEWAGLLQSKEGPQAAAFSRLYCQKILSNLMVCNPRQAFLRVLRLRRCLAQNLHSPRYLPLFRHRHRHRHRHQHRHQLPRRFKDNFRFLAVSMSQ